MQPQSFPPLVVTQTPGFSVGEVKSLIETLNVQDPPVVNVRVESPNNQELLDSVKEILRESGANRAGDLQSILSRASQSEKDSNTFVSNVLDSIKQMQESYRDTITSVVDSIPKEITVVTPPVEVNIPAPQPRNVEVLKDADGRVIGLKEVPNGG